MSISNKTFVNGTEFEVLNLDGDYNNREDLKQSLIHNLTDMKLNNEAKGFVVDMFKELNRVDPPLGTHLRSIEKEIIDKADPLIETSPEQFEVLDLSEEYFSMEQLSDDLRDEKSRLESEISKESQSILSNAVGEVKRMGKKNASAQIKSLDNILEKEFDSDGYNDISDLKDITSDYVSDIEQYEGKVEMARVALEWEYKVDNVEEYLDWESFSEGSNAGEAERLLAELDEERRTEVIKNMAEEGSLPQYEGEKQISSVWQDRWGNLMGYDQGEGKAVKLVDSYDQMEEKIESIERSGSSIKDMLEDAKSVVGDYEKAFLKSLQQEDGEYLSSGEIDEKELLEYVDENKELNSY